MCTTYYYFRDDRLLFLLRKLESPSYTSTLNFFSVVYFLILSSPTLIPTEFKKMRVLCLLAVITLGFDSSQAFTTNNVPSQSSRLSSTKLQALTHKDIINRARKAVGQPEIEDEPQIFDKDILEDMQAALLILEKRVKQGPGCLSQEEILELESLTGKIVTEMYDYNKQSIKPAQAAPSSPVSPSENTAEDILRARRNATPGGEAKPLVADLPAAIGPKDPEYNSEEGSEFDGTGGLGLAKGTANTYVIEGMDEMTGEEYRKALQESVIARQEARRKVSIRGNMASQNYLDNLK